MAGRVTEAPAHLAIVNKNMMRFKLASIIEMLERVEGAETPLEKDMLAGAACGQVKDLREEFVNGT